MNTLRLKNGVYRLTKAIPNPCYDKKRPRDWRHQKEFSPNALYIVSVHRGEIVTDNIDGAKIDKHYMVIQLENGSPGAGTCGTIRFRLHINTPHGKKPRLSNITIPESSYPVPLELLCSLKQDLSAKAYLSIFRCRNFRQCQFSYLDVIERLAESGKITAADIHDAIEAMLPNWDVLNEYPWKS